LRGEPVLGGDAVDRLLLLNGPLRDAARGRGPERFGRAGAGAEAGGWHLVGVPGGGAGGLRLRPQAVAGPGLGVGGRRRGAAGVLRPGADAGRGLVGVPLPLHDARGRRVPVAAGARERVRAPRGEAVSLDHFPPPPTPNLRPGGSPCASCRASPAGGSSSDSASAWPCSPPRPAGPPP